MKLPDHAYVPGKTGRHVEGAFDGIRASVAPGAGPDELTQGDAWRFGLAWLEAGFYWEAHELFEPVWMALPEGTPERKLAQALIQIANAGLKRQMERPHAVERLLELTEELVEASFADAAEPVMGLTRKDMQAMIEAIQA